MQYQRHDVFDWINGNENGDEPTGFASRGGPERVTIGIWMWSEVFTCDRPDGEKLAIILLDTQGIFDIESIDSSCTAVFAVSMLLSSIQCYNVSKRIQEADLRLMKLISDYGKLVLDKTDEKVFQKLVFVVRDSEYKEYPSGYAPGLIDDVLNENHDQPGEFDGLRARIKASFDSIEAFLFPDPGISVSQAEEFNSRLVSANPEFVECLKQLAPSLLAPENLIAKRIAGRKVQAHQFLRYIQGYVRAFSYRALPAPPTMLLVCSKRKLRDRSMMTCTIRFSICFTLHPPLFPPSSQCVGKEVF